jgi:hypothetical protein
MQLIQIGEIRQKTVLELIEEMAARQFAEIEQLKGAAQNRAAEARSRSGRRRCHSAKEVA